MASRVGPRSVKDATRFTSTIPHATSKAAGPGPVASSRTPPRVPGESPEQRVKRLRMAHLAAQKAQISRTDKVIDASRRFLDVAHRWTVGGIVIFTAVATVVSIYSVWDMLRYNRARRAEWVQAQVKLEADSLAAARLAYIKGTATEEQILLVEEANREAEEAGTKLPPLLAPPEQRTHFEEHFTPAVAQAEEAKAESKGKGVLGLVSGIWGSKPEETATSESPDGMVQAAEAKAGYVQDKAKGVWEQERENQRRGGNLDRLGLETGIAPQEPTKRGWWPF